MSVYTDNFNRADENPLGNSVWTQLSGAAAVLQLVSNQVTSSTSAQHGWSYYSGATFGANQYTQAKVGTFNGLDCVWFWRATDYANCYWARISTALVEVRKRVTGTSTTILSINGTYSAGDVFKFQMVGQTITVYRNGSPIGTVDDSQFSSGVLGIGVYGTTARLDDWEGADAGGLDFTHTGAVSAAGTFAAGRTVEKNFTATVSGEGTFASTKSIEKFVTGLVSGVATYNAYRTIEKVVTGTVIGEGSFSASRVIEKFFNALVEGEGYFTASMSFTSGLLNFTHTGAVSGELTLAAQRAVEKCFTGQVSAELALAAARTVEKVITGGISGEFYLSSVLSRPGWFTTTDKPSATTYSLASKPATSWSLSSRPTTSYSLVAKPTGTALDGAFTDPTQDGAYTETRGPYGAWTDTGDGWTPVWTVDPTTWTGIDKPK